MSTSPTPKATQREVISRGEIRTVRQKQHQKKMASDPVYRRAYDLQKHQMMVLRQLAEDNGSFK